MSVTDFLLFVLSRDPEFKSSRQAFFSPKNHESLQRLLTTILEDEKGSVIQESDEASCRQPLLQ